MVKSLLALGVIGVLTASVAGQTSDNLVAKYPAISAYEVRPGILMTAKYAGDGQVCEMVLERRYTDGWPGLESAIFLASNNDERMPLM